MKTFYSMMIVVAFSVLAVVVALAKDADQLQDDLKKVRERIMEAQNKATEENWRYIRAKDRIVYSNDVVKAVYLDMKQAEKTFNEKRQKLEEEVMKLPEIREVLKTRGAAFAEVRKLKDEEELILKEMKAVKPAEEKDAEAKKE